MKNAASSPPTLGEAIDKVPVYLFDLMMITVCTRWDIARVQSLIVNAQLKGASYEEIKKACERALWKPRGGVGAQLTAMSNLHPKNSIIDIDVFEVI
ncbi:MAG: hypothetical protein ACOY5B_15615 [Spirochaetota bacterium]